MSGLIDPVQVAERFERWLAGRPLAERSRREYARNVRAFCAWLEQTPDRAGWQGDPLADPLARDHAAFARIRPGAGPACPLGLLEAVACGESTWVRRSARGWRRRRRGVHSADVAIAVNWGGAAAVYPFVGGLLARPIRPLPPLAPTRGLVAHPNQEGS